MPTFLTNRSKTAALPLAVYVLGLSIFAQGTSELMLAGILPIVAEDLHVSIPTAGLLVSGFAIGMLIGAPLLAILTLRWQRRRTLLLFMGIFIVMQVVGALAPNYAVLFASRMVGAFVYAGFWAVATVTTGELVPVTMRGRAMSIVTGGLTIASVLGVPVGTLIGQHFGWRVVFLVIAGASLIAMVGVFATVHPSARPAGAPRLRTELRGMVNPRLLLAYGTIALTVAGGIVTFSYLAPLLTETTGLAASVVPVLLLLYGVGTFIGITIGGRTADAHPIGTLLLGISGMVLTLIAFALFADQALPTIVLVFLLGFFAFLTNPALNTRVFTLAGKSPTLAPSTTTSAFNIGITIGPWLGGLAIGAGYGYASTAWIGAAFGIAALLTVVAAARLGVTRAESVRRVECVAVTD